MPNRFRKIRHYGLLANACKKRKLTLAFNAIALKQLVLLSKAQRKALAKKRLFTTNSDICPCCKKGNMISIDILPANKSPPISFAPFVAMA